ncbi:MAG: ACP S-malonyltransferase [Chlamydiales bacterium]|nr:ACP S-malonyltransferase [Chlamydiales bacterium]
MPTTAFIFPGQGAQKPRMGFDFYQKHIRAKEVFQLADDILQNSFSKVIFTADEKELALTKNSQLAIYITSMAILTVMKEEFSDLIPIVCGGLSLGEYSAITASNKVDIEQMLPIVAARGNFMHEASIAKKGCMAAVLGMDAVVIEQAINSLYQQGHLIWVANINCPGQVVISGTIEGVEIASLRLKEIGAKRVIPLDVSGAFHSGLMKSAQDKLSPLIEGLEIKDSAIYIAGNVTGSVEQDSRNIKQNLILQVTQPVRWQQCVQTIETYSPKCYLEIGPGNTLAGMNRKIGVKAPTISIEKVEDLEKIYELELV